MTVSFDQMPDDARIWVYQADRTLSEEEIQKIQVATREFTDSWVAHGKPLKASFGIEFNQFLVLAVDETSQHATGCSIDSSVAFIKELGSIIGSSFLDRSKIAVLQNDEVILLPLSNIKTAINAGKISTDSKVINNSVSRLSDWKDMWIQPAAESWMKRYFN